MFYIVSKTNAGVLHLNGPYASFDLAKTALAGPDTLVTGSTSGHIVKLESYDNTVRTGLDNAYD